MSVHSTLESLYRAAKPCRETLLLLAVAVPVALALDAVEAGPASLPVAVALLVGVHAALRERVGGGQ